MRLLPAAVASGLLLAAATVGAALEVRQDVAVTPSAVLPILLAAGTAGATALGASQTSATTTGATLPALGSAQVLKVLRGSTDYRVQVEFVSLSGAGAADTMTLSLVGTTTQAQVVVTLGSVTQSTGTAVSLPAAGPDTQVVAAGACVGTCTFTLRILLYPTSGSNPVAAYPYSLAVT